MCTCLVDISGVFALGFPVAKINSLVQYAGSFFTERFRLTGDLMDKS